MEPVAEEPFLPDGVNVTPWAEACRRLAEADTYWLATARPDARPHVMPVLAVWANDALHFCTGPRTRKGRNLADRPYCVLTTGTPGVDLVVEGRAAKVTDEERLLSVAAYARKYDWHVNVRDGAFHDVEGAPTAGPPPYDTYMLAPSRVIALGTDDCFSPTRWRF